jgi:hypothetical protein
MSTPQNEKQLVGSVLVVLFLIIILDYVGLTYKVGGEGNVIILKISKLSMKLGEIFRVFFPLCLCLSNLDCI